jgi:subtilisin family serine protease
VERGAKIINLSLGSEADSPFLHEVITSSYKQGVIFFASPGNEPVTTATYPAAYPEVTAVTALDGAGNIADYANRGDFIKAAGPGTVFVTFNNQTYMVTGTSAATAYVSGVAAAAAERTGKPLSQIQQAIPTLMPVKK